MGNLASGLLGKPREQRFLMNGLDAAGKTTILYKLKLGEVEMTIPTIGMNIETVRHRSGTTITSFTCWDVGGRCSIRPLLRHFYKQGFEALIFVLDCNDRERTDDALQELQRILDEDDLSGLPLLVFANKQDLPSALKAQDVAEKLGLRALRNRLWFIQSTVATTGDGIYEGLDWLSRTLASKR
mmetsp:Transcript_42236/g.76372  ORF Transcript_42236/g.76372 Transcript_42236/m.76372 type:complete len:184 (+) Transcript_42236:76-627(+)